VQTWPFHDLNGQGVFRVFSAAQRFDGINSTSGLQRIRDLAGRGTEWKNVENVFTCQRHQPF
jgi:hypothetical protein